MRSVLVCDLDGTLLGDDRSLRELLWRLGEPGAPMLVFATGRQAYSARELLGAWNVTQGEYLIAGVGTELYRRVGKKWISIAGWPALRAPWDSDRVRRCLARLPIRRQPLAASSAYKLSYFAPRDLVAPVSSALHEAGCEATVVHSHTELLDVLPSGIDKGSAVCSLAARLGVPLERVMTCGDTTNDLAMLQLACPSVIVGNGEEDLRAAAPGLERAYLAVSAHAAGIIEGLRHYGWLNDDGWQCDRDTRGRCP